METLNTKTDEQLMDIFEEKFRIPKTSWNDETISKHLLGHSFKFSPVELLSLFFTIEKTFNIKIPELAIIENRFISFNKISNLIKEILFEKR